MPKHKWAEVIHAFADGQPIQYRNNADDVWRDWSFPYSPEFLEGTKYEYRIYSKWQTEKDAFAAGKTIQYRVSPDSEWRDTNNPLWWENQTTEYRVKPEPKPDIVREAYLDRDLSFRPYFLTNAVVVNVRIVWDGETRELKDVRMLK